METFVWCLLLGKGGAWHEEWQTEACKSLAHGHFIKYSFISLFKE